MFRIIIVSYLLIGCVNLYGQTYKFYYSNYPKFLKQGTNDTLKMPFTGGLNTPNFRILILIMMVNSIYLCLTAQQINL